VEFSRTTLADAFAQFNRENRVQITLADADVGHLVISGIF
jgi:ferric-dicitrate binding protein FerR (iron transport regulator)